MGIQMLGSQKTTTTTTNAHHNITDESMFVQGHESGQNFQEITCQFFLRYKGSRGKKYCRNCSWEVIHALEFFYEFHLQNHPEHINAYSNSVTYPKMQL